MKVRATSVGCQRDEMLVFTSFQPQPYPQYFCAGENRTKIAYNRTTVLTAAQGSASLRESRTFPLLPPLVPAPLQSHGAFILFAGPAVTRLGSAELLEFFCKQKQLDYRNEACDLL